ncbi:MAG TPA: phospholipase, partial [Burkholderiaceae bacterium]|nr:phospholipase [Burkholderiaceae bacterium]
MALWLAGTAAHAQAAPAAPAAAASKPWQQCTAISADREARLACFDRWAQHQAPAAQAASQPPLPPVDASVPATRIIEVARTPACKDTQYSELSRFWELESGTDCGSLGLRSYRPLSLSVIGSSSVNTKPSSPSPDHTAAEAVPYRRT